MIRLALVASAVSFAAGVGGTWHYTAIKHQRELDRITIDHQRAHVKALETAHADTIRLQSQKDAAQRKHAAQKARLALDADNARSELDRLRDVIARGVPRDTGAAAVDYAAAANVILGECAAELEGLARKADGHASDAAMIMGAWPRP